MNIKKLNKKGFTLVEIMIVVAIIALLAIMAIPGLLRAKVSANDAIAKSNLRTLSTASESYASDNNGNYPGAIASLTGATPAYLNTNFCTGTHSGFTYSCTMATSGYTFVANPVTAGTTGTRQFTMTTGGVIQ